MQKNLYKNIYIFIDQPLNNYNINRFYFKNYPKNLTLKIYNLSQIAFKGKNIVDINKNHGDVKFLNNHFILKNLSSIYHLRLKNNFYYISFISDPFLELLLELKLKFKTKRKISVMTINTPEPKNSFVTKFAFYNSMKKKILIKNILSSFFLKILKNSSFKNFVISSKKINKKSILIPSLNFNDYIKMKNHTKINIYEKNCITFLDQNLSNHPDFQRYGISPPINSNDYWGETIHFLDKLSSHLKKEVIISKHPRNQSLSETISYLVDKKNIHVSESDTINSINNSNFCVTHSSFSFEYAVLLKKPILFITNNFLDNNKRYYDYCRYYSNILGMPLLNISDKYDLELISNDLIVNQQLYDNYIFKYINPTNENNISWDIIFNNL